MPQPCGFIEPAATCSAVSERPCEAFSKCLPIQARESFSMKAGNSAKCGVTGQAGRNPPPSRNEKIDAAWCPQLHHYYANERDIDCSALFRTPIPHWSSGCKRSQAKRPGRPCRPRFTQVRLCARSPLQALLHPAACSHPRSEQSCNCSLATCRTSRLPRR